MGFKILDPIFSHQGKPGIVREIKDGGASLLVDQDRAVTVKENRHGYVKGLTPLDRQNFNEFMDSVCAEGDVPTKFIMLQSKISELEPEQRTSTQARNMLSYYKSELSHLMHTYNYTPRHYGIDKERVP